MWISPYHAGAITAIHSSTTLGSCPRCACAWGEQEKKFYKLLNKNLELEKSPLGEIELEVEWKFQEGAGDKVVKQDEFAEESNDPVKTLKPEEVRTYVSTALLSIPVSKRGPPTPPLLHTPSHTSVRSITTRLDTDKQLGLTH